jgi:5-methylcytosine-specific restriction endonuclease McrA
MVMDTVRELTRALAHLLRREHTALAEFLVALADFDRKRLWMDLGYTSLFQFLRAELHLSKAAAQYRKGRDAMELVAELQPHPAPPSRTVVTIPAPAPWLVAATGDEAAGLVPALAPATEGKRGSAIRGSPAELTIREAPAPPLRPSRPAEVVPLDADERRLHLTVSKRFLAKLAAATDALGHSHAAASEAEILEAGLDLLLAQAAKRNGLVERPQKTPRSAKPDHVPATVKRAVYLRDSGRCQYRLASGEVCGCTRRLQYDHVIPRALGGPSTVDNVRLVCAPHNLLAARLALGDEVMDRYTSNPRTREQNARRPGRPRDEHADGR